MGGYRHFATKSPIINILFVTRWKKNLPSGYPVILVVQHIQDSWWWTLYKWDSTPTPFPRTWRSFVHWHMLQSHSGWSKFVGQPLITPIIFVVYKMIEVLQKFRISSKLSSRVLYKIIIVYIVRLYIFYIIWFADYSIYIIYSTEDDFWNDQMACQNEYLWKKSFGGAMPWHKQNKTTNIIKRRTKYSLDAKTNLEHCKHK